MSDGLRTNYPKVADLLDEAREDVLAYMAFPKVGAILIGQTDEWATGHRYFSQQSMNKIATMDSPADDLTLLTAD